MRQKSRASINANKRCELPLSRDFTCAFNWLIPAATILAIGAPALAQPPSPTTMGGSGEFVRNSSTGVASTTAVDFETDEPLSATYVSADVATVVNQVLGDFLKVDFSIAPDVSGVVTMRMENVHTRLSVIDALRTALRPMGISVIDRGDFVAVARGSEQAAPAQGGAISPGQPSPPGGGIVILTPRSIAPSQLAQMIAPFAPGATIAMIDDARRFLLIKGDEASITALSSAAVMFDVDWFGQVPIATFDLTYVTPTDLMKELRALMGPSFANVDFVPVPRLSRLVVLAKTPEAIATLRPWITRLDVPNSTLSAGVLVYRPRNASAESLAKSLQDTGSGGGEIGASATATTSTSPAAPGAPPATRQPSPGDSTTSARDMIVSFNLTQNAVIVRGTADQIAEARGLLEALDQPPPQVLIEAAIIEVTLDNELQYGVNWRGLEDRFTGTFTDAANGRVTSNFPGFALTYVNTDIEAALNLLSSITKVEVVSRPSVLALNNEVANLQVGDQVPIVTQTAISVVDPNAPIVNQTTYRDTGVILKVTPRVRAGGTVELVVAQEVSQVARTTSSGIDSPTIQQRKIESTLVVPSGQSVALGGLISTTQTGSVTGIPLLMDIPLLGQLFRSDGRITERTELIVFVTPRILVDGASAVEATDQLRSAFRKLEQDFARR